MLAAGRPLAQDVPQEDVSTESMRPQKPRGAASFIPTQEQQERGLKGSGAAGLVVFIVCIIIYNDQGEGGAAFCAEDLSGFLYVQAWVALGQCVAPLLFTLLALFCVGAERPLFALHGSAQLGAAIFGFAWFVLGNIRLYGTVPCDTDAGGSCCNNVHQVGASGR